ncbi:hypothetical protein EDB19DRAFT_1908622 [Suillus lakei]|nr:hypothetical protein EDB19DRAFT_1908622 [Suillus lakei]
MFSIAERQSSVESFHTARSNAEDNFPPGCTGQEQVKQEVRAIAESVLSEIPLRLINTRNGKMYSGTTLITKFEESEIFHSLLTLTTTRSMLKQEQYINEEVRNFFAYVMLSHRWEGVEPVFKDVAEGGVYNLPEPRSQKIRNFCRKARGCGFDWAWIDTYCIDQDSSSDIQTSIASMFAWYRRSALTIIYLSDVEESNEQALFRSQWFRRGWTLQELLAAKTIRLYKKDWTPFPQRAPFNHKNVPEIRAALASATGIQKSFIKFYPPSFEDPRMKLRWARHRVTKRKEDEAYCLMRIFGFSLTVRYGEGGDHAFSRLLMEIMRNTRDATLLDWIGQPSTLNSCLPSSPRCFVDAPFAITEMTFDGLLRPGLSFASAAKLVLGFKGAIRRARISSHLGNGHNTSQEPSGDGSPTMTAIGYPPCDDDGAPHTARTTSSQGIFSLKRSWNSAFEENEIMPLAKLLEKPPWPYKLNPESHITVPCFVHEVLRLYFMPAGSYSCRADGIKSFSLVTSEKLKILTDHRTPSPYLLARPWDPRLSYDSSPVYPTTVPLLRRRLKNPFFAMLLERRHDGMFRRIPTNKRIVVELEELPPQTYGVRFLDLQ